MSTGVQRLSILPTYLIRLAGFSFHRLDRLRFPDSVAAVAEAQMAEASLCGATGRAIDLLRRVRPPEEDRALRASDRKRWWRLRQRLRDLGSPEGDFPDDLARWAIRREPVTAGVLEDSRSAHRRLEVARRQVAERFDRELGTRRAAMRELLRDERLQEAIFLESPGAYDGVLRLLASDGGERTPRVRSRERTAAMYLQRFCAKNDTHSMCGPLAVARLAGDGGPPRMVVEDDAALRRSYFSYWAAERLYHAFASRLAEDVTVVRRNPALLLDDAGGGTATARWCLTGIDAASQCYVRRQLQATLVAEARFALEALDRPRARGELARLLCKRCGTQEAAEELVEGLVAAGLLVTAPALPVGSFTPLTDLRAAIARGWPEGEEKERARREIRGLEALVEDFGRGDLAARRAATRELDAAFSRLTGAASRRGHGDHYADRWLLHEDCHAGMRAVLGTPAVDAVLPDLSRLVAAAALPLELARENVRHWFREELGAAARLPMLEAHRLFDRDQPARREAPTAAARELRRRIETIRGVVRAAIADAERGVAHLETERLDEALAGAPGGARGGYASADLMLARDPSGGSLSWVVGEMHGFFLLPTFWFDVAAPEAREGALAEMRGVLRRLAGPRASAEAILLHTQATDRRYPLADVDLLMVGATDRPGAVALGEVEMWLDGDGFRFSAGERELAPLAAFGVYPFLLYTSPLAPLVDDFAGRFFPTELLPAEADGGDAPRLTLGGTVFRRATWVRSAGELAATLGTDDGALLLARAQELRRQLGVPALVFVSVAVEPKPVLLDFTSYFLVEAVSRLLQRVPPEAPVRLTEMLPAPDQLWLEGPDGHRTFELRVGLYREPRSTPSSSAPAARAGGG